VSFFLVLGVILVFPFLLEVGVGLVKKQLSLRWTTSFFACFSFGELRSCGFSAEGFARHLHAQVPFSLPWEASGLPPCAEVFQAADLAEQFSKLIVFTVMSSAGEVGIGAFSFWRE